MEKILELIAQAKGLWDDKTYRTVLLGEVLVRASSFTAISGGLSASLF